MTKAQIKEDMIAEYMFNIDMWWMLRQAGEYESATGYHNNAMVYETMLKKYFSIDAFQLWLDREDNR